MITKKEFDKLTKRVNLVNRCIESSNKIDEFLNFLNSHCNEDIHISISISTFKSMSFSEFFEEDDKLNLHIFNLKNFLIKSFNSILMKYKNELKSIKEQLELPD